MTIKCEFSILVAQPSVSIRLKTQANKLAEVFKQGYEQISRYIQGSEGKPAGAPYAIFYTLDTRDLDVEFGLPLAAPLSGRNNIQASQTPEGKSISCIHIGPYSELDPSYRALTEWIKNNGYEAAGIAYEMYLNDPTETPPDKLQTRRYQLIRTLDF